MSGITGAWQGRDPFDHARQCDGCLILDTDEGVELTADAGLRLCAKCMAMTLPEPRAGEYAPMFPSTGATT